MCHQYWYLLINGSSKLVLINGSLILVSWYDVIHWNFLTLDFYPETFNTDEKLSNKMLTVTTNKANIQKCLIRTKAQDERNITCMKTQDWIKTKRNKNPAYTDININIYINK